MLQSAMAASEPLALRATAVPCGPSLALLRPAPLKEMGTKKSMGTLLRLYVPGSVDRWKPAATSVSARMGPFYRPSKPVVAGSSPAMRAV